MLIFYRGFLLIRRQDFVENTTIFDLNQIETKSVTSIQKAKESMKDEFTSKIIQALKTGKNLEKLGHTNYEHTIQDDCLFRGNRVVIP